ncbi:hypothetical protein DPMN_143056 [Dreissena polymorpha]|uniref:Uncharacterized protein n=1 Tax=Dreissena polymorpha TaxID=45954 RepID=A0A9D4GCE2_DREPO|nr:hypothetical protein DPMN_143056 [Dreissena polymorpha]
MHRDQKLRTWTSVELHEKYVSFGGALTGKQLIANVLEQLEDKAVVLRIAGCASIVGFRDYVSKIVKISECEDVTVQSIKTEACGISYRNKDYDLSEFTTDTIKEQTSSTLLRFISKLISNGEITKSSMSLSQAIQYCITKRYNQSTSWFRNKTAP